MMSRCKLTEVKQSHSNSEFFPYTADQLAIYMNYLCEQREAPEQEPSEISDIEVESEREVRIVPEDPRAMAGIRIGEETLDQI